MAQRGPGRSGSWTPGVCALMHQDSLQIPGWRGEVPAALERAWCPRCHNRLAWLPAGHEGPRGAGGQGSPLPQQRLGAAPVWRWHSRRLA